MSESVRPRAGRRRFIRLAASAAIGAPASLSLLMQPGRARPLASTVHWQGIALGAHTSIALVHRDQEQAQRVLRAAIDEIERLEQIFSLYRADSIVVRLNRHARLSAPAPDLLVLLGHVNGIHQATSGTFDPTVQTNWLALDASSKRTRGTGHAARREPVKVPGDTPETGRWRHVRYDATAVAFEKPGMAITLNGIAQGFVTERVASLFRAQGFHDVLVDIGEIKALGHRDDGQAWKVGLAERQDGTAEDQLSLTDLAVATSAPLGQRFDASAPTGVVSGHIIDPTTGRPCVSPWRRLSVVHRSATVADGLSTGLIMHDRAGIESALAHYPGTRVLALSEQGVRTEISSGRLG